MTQEAERPKERTPQELAFAAAVRTLLETAQAAGITQGEIAEACRFHTSRLSKWKNATLIPTQEDLDSVLHHLAHRGHVPKDSNGLRHLRQQAKDIRLERGTQQGAWEEKLSALRSELSAMTDLHRTTTAKLDDFTNRLTALDEELSRAMTRASAAESERDRLHHQTQEQGWQLAAAATYIRQVEEELAGSRHEVQCLRREIGVLQHQVRLLQHDAPQAARQEVAAPSTQVSAVNVRETAHPGPPRHTPARHPRGLLDFGTSTDRARRIYVEWRRREARNLNRLALAMINLAICAFPALLLGTSTNFMPTSEKTGKNWADSKIWEPVGLTAAEWIYIAVALLLLITLILSVIFTLESRLRLRPIGDLELTAFTVPPALLLPLGSKIGEYLHLEGLAIPLLKLVGLRD